MPRPLMQHGVGQLEDMFGTCRGNLQVLRQLENELQHRQVPRALALLEKVQAGMAASGDAPRERPSQPPTKAPTPATAPPTQPELWGRTPTPVVPPVRLPPSPAVAVVPTPQPPRPAPPVRPADAPAAPKPAAPTAPTMPLEEAYKLLNATYGSTWESVEQTRRQLVQKAHPSKLKSLSSDRRNQAIAEARRTNTAYAALSQARCRAT